MIKYILVSVLALVFSSAVSFSGELDNERAVIEQAKKSLAKNLPAAVVIKVNETTKEVEVLHSSVAIAKESALEFAKSNTTNFVALSEAQKRGELDQDSSKSSWFFGFNLFGHHGGFGSYPYNNYYYNYPYYNYGGYNFQYYNYNYINWGGYGYYYYCNPYYRYY